MPAGVNINVQSIADNFRDLEGALATMQEYEVLVGVPADTTERKDGEPVTNAELAYIQNYGSPAANIPARPFMEPGIHDKETQTVSLLTNAADEAFEGHSTKNYFEAVGQINVDGIKNRIRSNTPPPLAESTLKARQRKGILSDRTLVRTGEMLNSMRSVVRKTGGE